MTWRESIAATIRSFILNSIVGSVVSDIDTNGLTTADEAVIDAYLDLTKP